MKTQHKIYQAVKKTVNIYKGPVSLCSGEGISDAAVLSDGAAATTAGATTAAAAITAATTTATAAAAATMMTMTKARSAVDAAM